MKYQRLGFPERGRCEAEEGELDERLASGEVIVQNRISLAGGTYESALFDGDLSSEPNGIKGRARPRGAVVGKVVESEGALKPGTRVTYSGSHATHAKVSETCLLPLPDEISDERACFISYAAQAMSAPRLLPARMGEHVLVIGMGLCGNLAAQLYAQSGAGRVACADRHEARLGKARACGLIETYDLSQKPLADWTGALGSRGAELIVEATGTSAGFEDALNVIAKKGIVAQLQPPVEKVTYSPFEKLHEKGVMLVGASEALLDPDAQYRDRQLLLEWLRWSKLKVDPLITHTMHFTEAAQAYEGLRDRPGEFMGIVLNY